MSDNGDTVEFDVDVLRQELEKIIEYFSREYELSYAEIIGVVEVVKQNLYHEMIEVDEDE